MQIIFYQLIYIFILAVFAALFQVCVFIYSFYSPICLHSKSVPAIIGYCRLHHLVSELLGLSVIYVDMAGPGCGKQPIGHPVDPNPCGFDVEQLKRQIEFLTQRVAELEASRSFEEGEGSDGDFENPFHGRAPHRQPPVRDDRRWQMNIKLEIP